MFVTGRPARSAAMPVLFLLSGSKIGFSQVFHRLTRCPDKREIWHGERTSPCQILRLSEGGRNVGIQPPKLSKFQILAINLLLSSHSFAHFYDIHRFCTRLQVDFKFLIWLLSGDKPSYKHFPAVGAFSLKFSIAPSGETTDRIKKVREAKTGRTSSITVPSMVGIVGRAPAVDEKV